MNVALPEHDASRIDVASGSGSYPVFVGQGLLQSVPRLAQAYTSAERFVVIADDIVGPLHGERLAEGCREAGLDVAYLTFPAGESSKTRRFWSILTDEMLDAGLGRDCCVIAVGGGVTTDLAGFVAATYLRGVPVIQVPSSYLAMIDASVGGKTGVDVRSGKNLVGAFHPPRAVIADTELLTTLPRRERAQGLVEAFKHGAILDADHFEALASGLSALLDAEPSAAEQAIRCSVRIKAEVVSRDEFEGGYRQVLNFGHTIGHVIEAASDYTIGHGSAVALGMLAEAEIGERLNITAPGTRDTLESTLQALLPVDATSVEGANAIEYLGLDKKARAGRTRYVLLKRMGEVAQPDGWTYEAPDLIVREALDRVLRRP
ncbi:MAG: 3-dehydroquinate synthase [Gemmatimonadetes bacterium]|nr:3-dehydroquinate synthase [Gemmatimonadota bacterium]MDA1104775.1 3-dehydroquinate synthase [Gemmatimonadota bacterium]